jgi:hypothetical protein
MRYRLIVAALAALALLAPGCSSNKTTVAPPSAASISSTPASSPASTTAESTAAAAAEPLEPLGPHGCVDVTSANLNLAVATSAEEARQAADAFAKYDPPAPVTEAIDHFVATGGVHIDDPDFDEYNGRIDDWVKVVCPL